MKENRRKKKQNRMECEVKDAKYEMNFKSDPLAIWGKKICENKTNFYSSFLVSYSFPQSLSNFNVTECICE